MSICISFFSNDPGTTTYPGQMTTKIANVANLALHAFQNYSVCASAVSSTNMSFSGSSDDWRAFPMMSPTTDMSPAQHHGISKPSRTHTQPPESINRLLSSVRSLTPKDVGFDAHWVSDATIHAAPVAYVHIMENEVFSMGIFILRPGSRIPLHDHPGMFGVLRVLYGSVRCRSFTPLRNIKPGSPGYPTSPFSTFSGSRWQLTDLLVTQLHQDVVLTHDSDVQLLRPTEGNFHEITPVDGPAVFLDILAPPYDHDLGTRECHFYKEVSIRNPLAVLPSSEDFVVTNLSTSGSNRLNDSNSGAATSYRCNDQSTLIYLVETNQPKDYWCESAEYVGPSVK